MKKPKISDTPDNALQCFIASFINKNIDNKLEKIGISKGLISFAIPNFGIQFKCRTEGQLIEMEFAAFFSLLEFVTTKLTDEKISSVQVFSSLPHFIFALSENFNLMKADSPYRKLLQNYSRKLVISVGYVKPIHNEALKSPSMYPSLPQDKKIHLKFSEKELFKTEFKTIQRGIKF